MDVLLYSAAGVGGYFIAGSRSDKILIWGLKLTVKSPGRGNGTRKCDGDANVCLVCFGTNYLFVIVLLYHIQFKYE